MPIVTVETNRVIKYRRSENKILSMEMWMDVIPNVTALFGRRKMDMPSRFYTNGYVQLTATNAAGKTPNNNDKNNCFSNSSN